jgi:transposase
VNFPAEQPEPQSSTTEYKRHILAEYDAAPTGSRGAILRREELSGLHVIEWREAGEGGAATSSAAIPAAVEGKTGQVKTGQVKTGQVKTGQWRSRAEHAEVELKQMREAPTSSGE